ncbi:hypothetical protein IF1G_04261 [Cordyceps javanica]|uniref:Uncharacterized protein n=1 Tax=Cordyceps javanica TaxID=43265 RepID=A0A545V5M8_9HYPO|nr:hypothetical protein IF1G_04261 [Cordyceps javanica]TQW08275.1 hypothetical protein IF2G_04151 [Cordyceps javanica]
MMQQRVPILSQQSNVPSHEQLVNYVADRHAYLGNSSYPLNVTQPVNVTGIANRTMAALADVATTHISNTQGDSIIAGVILGIFFLFFVVVIVIDMRAKRRSGELHEDMKGIRNAAVLLLKMIPMLFVALFIGIASLVPKKGTKPGQDDPEAAAVKTLASQAIVKRLSVKSAGAETIIRTPSFGSDIEAGN